MHNSSSYIHQSIYESQTKNINLVPSQQSNIPKKDAIVNKTDQKTFLKYYEQNLVLKTRNQELLKSNRQLQSKLTSGDQKKNLTYEEELRELAKGKKNVWDTSNPRANKTYGSRGFSNKKPMNLNKVEHLMEIIDHYKAKLLVAQEEINNLKRQKLILQQDVRINQKKFNNLRDQKDDDMTVRQQVNIQQKLRKNIREIQLQKQKNVFLEMSVRDLQKKLKLMQNKTEDFNHLKAQNRSLEERLLKMTQLNSFSNVLEKGQDEKRGKELERELKLLKQKYNVLKDSNMKQEHEMNILRNKLVESAYDASALEKENQQLRKQSISDPLILRLSKDSNLVKQIIFEIDSRRRAKQHPQSSNNLVDTYDDKLTSKMKIQQLILEKQELAKILLAQQSKLHSLEQSYKQRQRLIKIQKHHEMIAVNQNKPGTTASRQGVLYDGDVSVFSEQVVNIASGTNYFDLFLSEVSLMETMLLSITGLSNPTSPLILATVDFYNHNTEHSKLTQGCKCDLQSEFSFKVNQDDFFLRFIKKGNFQVDVWASQGSKNFHLGRGIVDLKYLVARSRPRISPVIATAVPLYLGSKVMGSINLIFRLRLPIYDQIQNIHSENINANVTEQNTVTKKLVIQIQQGRGFGQKSNTFVYYNFRLEDYYTRTSKGNNPNWGYMKMIETAYDTDFKNFLRKGQIQLTVFDDSVVVIDDRDSDVVGTGTVSLIPLLQGKFVKERIQIRKGNQRKGTIDVKIFWHQKQASEKQNSKIQSQKKLNIYGIHEQLKNFMRQHSVDPQKIYRLIDSNRSGMISYDEFVGWFQKISTKKFTPEVLNTYYKGFKQPLNLNNFSNRLSRELQNEKIPEIPANVAEGLGKINELLKLNSTQMKKRTIQEFLAGKNVLQVAQNIETDQFGNVTKAKLQEYFDNNQIECELSDQKIKLVDFLRAKKKNNR